MATSVLKRKRISRTTHPVRNSSIPGRGVLEVTKVDTRSFERTTSVVLVIVIYHSLRFLVLVRKLALTLTATLTGCSGRTTSWMENNSWDICRPVLRIVLQSKKLTNSSAWWATTIGTHDPASARPVEIDHIRRISTPTGLKTLATRLNLTTWHQTRCYQANRTSMASLFQTRFKSQSNSREMHWSKTKKLRERPSKRKIQIASCTWIRSPKEWMRWTN